eukprot:CAMPEP_0119302158 /NCGR_PEP_ID=MMETSP1333-20130426/3822_1 /TAXON_ID=418940 /ORGANISM="Scyphosphaera apsteinii, Strain RCC1455" /LENGTH=70 /DNA_ID=CAMNT_0007304441 /DNA_START=78 /DNA_END=290 /DNA_ORIENTATION=+
MDMLKGAAKDKLEEQLGKIDDEIDEKVKEFKESLGWKRCFASCMMPQEVKDQIEGLKKQKKEVEEKIASM